ncbi:MAG TPA: NAD+ synthase [Thermoanaerobaculia bacterium]|nr:NAD+ synthase [Thermoanaerobaculia bacterium]
MKIYIGQLNPTVGALESNRRLIEDAYADGVRKGADIVMVPELAVTGYPPRDLLDRDVFVDGNLAVRKSLVGMTGSTALIFGCVARNELSCGKPLRNTAVVAQNGKVVLEQTKMLLPTYDVFDELRYFEPASKVEVVELFGKRVGVSICEDYWFDETVLGTKLYCENPVDSLMKQGSELLLNISASPFSARKRKTRYDLFRGIARRFNVPLVYVNQVGGNDELLFDGSSIVVNSTGQTVFCGKQFESDGAVVSLDGPVCESVDSLSEEEEIGRSLVLGLRDYITKCGFRDVVIGLSGGIDSAVTAAIAVEALGAAHVSGISMPSEFSSGGSVDDSRDLAERLGIRFSVVPIRETYEAYVKSFTQLFGDSRFDITNENVQARIRGNILMAWSNRTGAMVLSTGNKSEMAVGYCTLYGDMAGGLALLGDVYKTTVYKVTHWLNRNGVVIPEATIVKPPSAELRPDQVDQDSLPPYEILDGILKLFIEEWKELDEIVAAGYERAVVAKILKLVDGNEFKRRQAAPTIRVSTKAFGSGRQMPIAQRWRREHDDAAQLRLESTERE